MIQLIKNIWLILTLDCQGSAELTSESFDRPLHWSERVAVWFHCLICGKSRKLSKQMTVLDDRLGQMMVDSSTASDNSLSDAAKQRIAQSLSEARRSSD